MLGKLLALLETGERDRFAAHLYQSRREYRRVCETTGKSSKQIERCVISTFQIAESMGFKGDFRRWEDRTANWPITAPCEPESRAKENKGTSRIRLPLISRNAGGWQ